MEAFDPMYICNGSDNEGRYRYEAQPEICGWNLMKLTQTLEHFAPRAALRAIVGEYEGMFEKEYNAIMRRKLGLGVYQREDAFRGEGAAVAAAAASSSAAAASASSSGEESKAADSEELVNSFFTALQETGSDFTNCFRVLGKLVPGDQASYDATLKYLVSQCCSISTRLASLAPRIPEFQLRKIEQLMKEKPEVRSFEQHMCVACNTSVIRALSQGTDAK